jgi:hypothetical protein
MQDEIKPTINWPDIFTRYEQSGVNQKQFCEQEGLEFCQFKYHRKQKT